MLANYGFKDGSGDWYLTIDTEKCNGCGKCGTVCPSKALMVGEDEFDPFRDEPVASVKEEERKKLKYTCAPCKPGFGNSPVLCTTACDRGAISHSEGWRVQYGH
jgi:ferredoxin